MTDLAERGRLTARAAMFSASVACLLLAAKGYAAWATGSVAMLGSLADTALDLVASLVTLWAVRVAATPADREHRFGHGKAEALAALVQVMLIAVSATGLSFEAARRLIVGGQAGEAELGIGVSVLATLASIGLIAYQRRVIARTNSLAIRADNVHYLSDLALNLAVIAALALDRYAGLHGADPVFGIGIALWLLWGAWTTGAGAIDELMDREWPEERRARLKEIASAHPALSDVHDLRTRSSGAHEFAQFHVRVSDDMSVAEAHEVIDQVEAKLEEEFPNVEILIHTDPQVTPGAGGRR